MSLHLKSPQVVLSMAQVFLGAQCFYTVLFRFKFILLNYTELIDKMQCCLLEKFAQALGNQWTSSITFHMQPSCRSRYESRPTEPLPYVEADFLICPTSGYGHCFFCPAIPLPNYNRKFTPKSQGGSSLKARPHWIWAWHLRATIPRMVCGRS